MVYFTLTIYVIISVTQQPFKESKISLIDLQSNIILSLSILFGVFMYNNEYTFLLILAAIIILILNLYFILKVIGKIISGFSSQFDNYVNTLKLKIV